MGLVYSRVLGLGDSSVDLSGCCGNMFSQNNVGATLAKTYNHETKVYGSGKIRLIFVIFLYKIQKVYYIII